MTTTSAIELEELLKVKSPVSTSSISASCLSRTHLYFGNDRGDVFACYLRHGLVKKLGSHGGKVLCMVYSRRLELLFTGSSDHSTRIWSESESPALIQTLQLHSNSVMCLNCIGDLVLSGSIDKTFRCFKNDTDRTKYGLPPWFREKTVSCSVAPAVRTAQAQRDWITCLWTEGMPRSNRSYDILVCDNVGNVLFLKTRCDAGAASAAAAAAGGGSQTNRTLPGDRGGPASLLGSNSLLPPSFSVGGSGPDYHGVRDVTFLKRKKFRFGIVSVHVTKIYIILAFNDHSIILFDLGCNTKFHSIEWKVRVDDVAYNITHNELFVVSRQAVQVYGLHQNKVTFVREFRGLERLMLDTTGRSKFESKAVKKTRLRPRDDSEGVGVGVGGGGGGGAAGENEEDSDSSALLLSSPSEVVVVPVPVLESEIEGEEDAIKRHPYELVLQFPTGFRLLRVRRIVPFLKVQGHSDPIVALSVADVVEHELEADLALAETVVQEEEERTITEFESRTIDDDIRDFSEVERWRMIRRRRRRNRILEQVQLEKNAEEGDRVFDLSKKRSEVTNRVKITARGQNDARVMTVSQDSSVGFWSVSRTHITMNSRVVIKKNRLELYCSTFVGQVVISGHDGGYICFFDPESNRQNWYRPHPNTCSALHVFREDGKGFLVSGDFDGGIVLANFFMVFDRAPQFLRRCYVAGAAITAVSYSELHRRVIVGDGDGGIGYFSSQFAPDRIDRHAHSEGVTSLVVDGFFLFSASEDSTIRQWNLQNYELLRTFELHSRDVNLVFQIPKTSLLISADRSGLLLVFDYKDGTVVFRDKKHNVEVRSVTFHGGALYCGSAEGEIIRLPAPFEITSRIAKE